MQMIPVPPSETAPHRDTQGTGTGLDTWGREAGGPALLVEVLLLVSEGGPSQSSLTLCNPMEFSRQEYWSG